MDLEVKRYRLLGNMAALYEGRRGARKIGKFWNRGALISNLDFDWWVPLMIDPRLGPSFLRLVDICQLGCFGACLGETCHFEELLSVKSLFPVNV